MLNLEFGYIIGAVNVDSGNICKTELCLYSCSMIQVKKLVPIVTICHEKNMGGIGMIENCLALVRLNILQAKMTFCAKNFSPRLVP